MTKLKIAINLVAHDGISSLYTGVGRVVQDTISILCRKQVLDSQYAINAITGRYCKDCLGFDPKIRADTEIKLKKTGGELFECLNGSRGEISYGQVSNWRLASISAATLIYAISKKYPGHKFINLCLDTPFAQVANFYSQYNQNNHIFVWVPHSTGLIHKVDSAVHGSESYLPERTNWEKEAVSFANGNPHNFVGYISHHMKQHLIKEYEAKIESLVPFINGLDKNDLRYQKQPDEPSLIKILRRYNISPNKKILLSFGRLEPYKGFDFTIKLGGLLARHGYQTVLIAQPYHSGDPAVEKYKELFMKHNPSGVFVHKYPFDLPHKLLRWKNTKILLIPSKAEPFGLIPSEVRLYRNPNLILVTSSAGGLNEQVEDGVDGFLIDVNNLDESYAKILEISSLNQKEVKKVSRAGYRRVCRDYDLEKNLTESLSYLCSYARSN